MRGWALNRLVSREEQAEINEGRGPFVDLPPPENEVVGIIMDKNFPEPDLVVETLRECPFRPVVWVVRENDKSAKDACEAAGIEPILAPLVSWWKVGDFDGRKRARESDILGGCTRVLVFRDKNSAASKEWTNYVEGGGWEMFPVAQKVRVIERGKVKAPKGRKGRNPDA